MFKIQAPSSWLQRDKEELEKIVKRYVSQVVGGREIIFLEFCNVGEGKIRVQVETR